MKKTVLTLGLFLISMAIFSQTDSTSRSTQEAREQLSNKIKAKYSEIITYLDKNKSKTAVNYKTLITASQTNWENYVSQSCKVELALSKDATKGGDDFYKTCYTEKATSRLNELWQQFENIKKDLEHK